MAKLKFLPLSSLNFRQVLALSTSIILLISSSNSKAAHLSESKKNKNKNINNNCNSAPSDAEIQTTSSCAAYFQAKQEDPRNGDLLGLAYPAKEVKYSQKTGKVLPIEVRNPGSRYHYLTARSDDFELENMSLEELEYQVKFQGGVSSESSSKSQQSQSQTSSVSEASESHQLQSSMNQMNFTRQSTPNLFDESFNSSASADAKTSANALGPNETDDGQDSTSLADQTDTPGNYPRGSLRHKFCMPCAFFHKARPKFAPSEDGSGLNKRPYTQEELDEQSLTIQGGCRIGDKCDYCHLCSSDRLKERRKSRIRWLRQNNIGPTGKQLRRTTWGRQQLQQYWEEKNETNQDWNYNDNGGTVTVGGSIGSNQEDDSEQNLNSKKKVESENLENANTKQQFQEPKVPGAQPQTQSQTTTLPKIPGAQPQTLWDLHCQTGGTLPNALINQILQTSSSTLYQQLPPEMQQYIQKMQQQNLLTTNFDQNMNQNVINNQCQQQQYTIAMVPMSPIPQVTTPVSSPVSGPVENKTSQYDLRKSINAAPFVPLALQYQQQNCATPSPTPINNINSESESDLNLAKKLEKLSLSSRKSNDDCDPSKVKTQLDTKTQSQSQKNLKVQKTESETVLIESDPAIKVTFNNTLDLKAGSDKLGTEDIDMIVIDNPDQTEIQKSSSDNNNNDSGNTNLSLNPNSIVLTPSAATTVPSTPIQLPIAELPSPFLGISSSPKNNNGASPKFFSSSQSQTSPKLKLKRSQSWSESMSNSMLSGDQYQQDNCTSQLTRKISYLGGISQEVLDEVKMTMVGFESDNDDDNESRLSDIDGQSDHFMLPEAAVDVNDNMSIEEAESPDLLVNQMEIDQESHTAPSLSHPLNTYDSFNRTLSLSPPSSQKLSPKTPPPTSPPSIPGTNPSTPKNANDINRNQQINLLSEIPPPYQVALDPKLNSDSSDKLVKPTVETKLNANAPCFTVSGYGGCLNGTNQYCQIPIGFNMSSMSNAQCQQYYSSISAIGPLEFQNFNQQQFYQASIPGSQLYTGSQTSQVPMMSTTQIQQQQYQSGPSSLLHNVNQSMMNQSMTIGSVTVSSPSPSGPPQPQDITVTSPKKGPPYDIQLVLPETVQVTEIQAVNPEPSQTANASQVQDNHNVINSNGHVKPLLLPDGVTQFPPTQDSPYYEMYFYLKNWNEQNLRNRAEYAYQYELNRFKRLGKEYLEFMIKRVQQKFNITSSSQSDNLASGQNQTQSQNKKDSPGPGDRDVIVKTQRHGISKFSNSDSNNLDKNATVVTKNTVLTGNQSYNDYHDRTDLRLYDQLVQLLSDLQNESEYTASQMHKMIQDFIYKPKAKTVNKPFSVMNKPLPNTHQQKTQTSDSNNKSFLSLSGISKENDNMNSTVHNNSTVLSESDKSIGSGNIDSLEEEKVTNTQQQQTVQQLQVQQPSPSATISTVTKTLANTAEQLLLQSIVSKTFTLPAPPTRDDIYDYVMKQHWTQCVQEYNVVNGGPGLPQVQQIQQQQYQNPTMSLLQQQQYGPVQMQQFLQNQYPNPNLVLNQSQQILTSNGLNQNQIPKQINLAEQLDFEDHDAKRNSAVSLTPEDYDVNDVYSNSEDSQLATNSESDYDSESQPSNTNIHSNSNMGSSSYSSKNSQTQSQTKEDNQSQQQQLMLFNSDGTIQSGPGPTTVTNNNVNESDILYYQLESNGNQNLQNTNLRGKQNRVSQRQNRKSIQKLRLQRQWDDVWRKEKFKEWVKGRKELKQFQIDNNINDIDHKFNDHESDNYNPEWWRNKVDYDENDNHENHFPSLTVLDSRPVPGPGQGPSKSTLRRNLRKKKLLRETDGNS